MENTKSAKEIKNQLANLTDSLVCFLKSSHNLIVSDYNSSYVNISLNQRKEDLIKTKGKIGIYIFKDSKDEIKYIGKGGTSRRSSGTDLQFRIKQELSTGNEHSTLSRNIIEKDNISASESKTIIDNLTLNVLITGDRSANNRSVILNTEALENFFIAIYDPEYNK